MADSSVIPVRKHPRRVAGLSAATAVCVAVLLGMAVAAAGGGVWAQPVQQAGPDGKALWSSSTCIEKLTKQWVGQAVQASETQNLPILPAFLPIMVTVPRDGRPTTQVIHRSYWGIHGRRLPDGKLQWDYPSDWGCAALVHDAERAFKPPEWLRYYQQKNGLSLLLENSILGRLSTDGQILYAVDDLGLPPPPEALPREPRIFEKARLGNRLLAFSLPESGKLIGELGGRSSKDTDLQNTYFLGPPLPALGNLYVLNEKDSELRLLCLEPPQPRANPKVRWTLKLGTAPTSLRTDPGRRVRACLLAYGEDVLVCPTNAGFITGVDPRTGRQLWKYEYQAPGKKAGPASLTGTWKVTPPAIQDGKVVLTDPDGEAVYCLNLRNGQRLWQADRKDDLYLAGVSRDRVVLVGRSTCRALRLADGRPLWQVETGLPSGYGAIRGHTLYLPLKAAAATRRPEVCALDLATGRVLAHTRLRQQAEGGPEVPGNLLYADGVVISQTVTAITAYPQ